MTELLIPQEETLTETTEMTDIPVISKGFLELNLSDNILKGLHDMGFSEPSSIQKEAIPKILSGEDIIAKAPTGSGKTAAFAIPIIETLDLNTENTSIQSLILCPTRELAIQVHREFEKISKYFENVSVVSIYGGQNIEKQLNALKRNPQIIVATPGRLMDHLRRKSISLELTKTVILDEADEMLDMGFREDIHTILKDLPENHQTVLFSATMAKDIIELTKKFQRGTVIVDVTDNLLNTPNIEQQYFEVSEKNKMEVLTRLLYFHNVDLALVFCNTKSNVDKVVEILKRKGFFADAIHGDMNQAQREKVMRGFRNGSVKILVATDVAGRGIDVKNIDAVFNFDLPRDDEDYVHRIGRTGRAGTSGIAFSFISKRQVSVIKRIERANGVKIIKNEIPTADAIQDKKESSLFDRIKNSIIENDLQPYYEQIEKLISEGFELKNITAALLKFYLSREGQKKLANVTLGELEELSNEDNDFEEEKRSRRRGNRSSRSRNFSDNRRSSNRNNDRSKTDKKPSLEFEFALPSKSKKAKNQKTEFPFKGKKFSHKRKSRA